MSTLRAHYTALAGDPSTALGRLMGVGPGIPEPDEDAEGEGTDAGETETEDADEDADDETTEDEGEGETEPAETEPAATEAEPVAKTKPKRTKKAKAAPTEAEVAKLIKRANAKAIREDRAERAAEAKKEAERASMDETERLTAERDDAVAKAEKAEKDDASRQGQLQLMRAMASSDHRLVAERDLDHVSSLVMGVMEADDLDASEAFAKVAEESQHLFRQAPTGEPQAKAKKKKANTTSGPSSGRTKPEPTTETVDALTMTPEDFARELAKHTR